MDGRASRDPAPPPTAPNGENSGHGFQGSRGGFDIRGLSSHREMGGGCASSAPPGGRAATGLGPSGVGKSYSRGQRARRELQSAVLLFAPGRARDLDGGVVDRPSTRPAHPGPITRRGFTLAAALLVLAALEAIAWLAFTFGLGGKHFRQRDLDALAAPPPTQAEIDAWRTWGYDRELGWLRRPGTRETIADPKGPWSLAIDARGARHEPFAGAGGLVSAYGDSFTFGHEVHDDETWPHYLSERLGSRVDNWGHSAWGPDQALLRLRRNLPHERTAVVVLAVMTENIARLANCYRPFLTGDRNMAMAFKPMLAIADGAVAWVPNPLERADGPDDWHAAFARARVLDHWYRVNQTRVAVRFPYLLRLPEALAYVLAGRERPNLYDDPAAVARLDFVLDEWARTARAHAAAPMVVFIPEPSDLRRFVAGRPTRYQRYVAALRARTAGGGLAVVDVLEHPFDAARFNRRPFKDHPSPYGQRVVADVVDGALRAHRLLPDRAAPRPPS